MGSGGSPTKELERGIRDTASNFKKDPLGELIRSYTNVVTGGLAQYRPNTGNIDYGSGVHAADETVGEIGGRNKARLAGYAANDALQQAEIQQKKDLLDLQLQAYRSDVSASRSAQGARDTAKFRAGSALGASDGRDFLGL